MSFKFLVLSKYKVLSKVDPETIDEKLLEDREEMQEDDFQEFGNPPGTYWYKQPKG